MAVLDTTVFIDLRGRKGKIRKAQVEEVLDKLVSLGHVLSTTRINIAELYVGIQMSNAPAAEEDAVLEGIKGMPVFELDENAVHAFARTRGHWQKSGQLAGDMDTLIGAIALVHGEPLVTRNVSHFSKSAGPTVIGYGP